MATIFDALEASGGGSSFGEFQQASADAASSLVRVNKGSADHRGIDGGVGQGIGRAPAVISVVKRFLPTPAAAAAQALMGLGDTIGAGVDELAIDAEDRSEGGLDLGRSV